jgi:hypothetical protein
MLTEQPGTIPIHSVRLVGDRPQGIGGARCSPQQEPASAAELARAVIGLERALSEQIGLSQGVAFHSLRGCKIPSVISTVRPR